MNGRKAVEEKVFSYIRKHHMLQPQDKVVLGVSGGADSVCLLFVLLEWAKQTPLELAVVHVNHSIRREAGEDARYVEQLCRQQGISFYLKEEDVPALAREWKLSEEEAGRRVRYQAFRQVMQELSADKMAVAHNANDCSETMLFHLFRGTGIRGLSGIRPVTGERIIRPILCLERSEIEDYLIQRGIFYCQDSTNGEDDYTRNRIRHHILPYAEQEICTGAVAHMNQTAELLRETEDYLERQTLAARERCVVEAERSDNRYSDGERTEFGLTDNQEIRLLISNFLQEDMVIQKRLLHSLLLELSPEQKDISGVHVRDLLELFVREGNRSIQLPQGIRAARQYGQVLLWKEGSDSEEPEKRVIWELSKEELESGEYVVAVEGGNQFLFRVFPYKKEMKVPENQYTKWFDYDKIIKSLSIRSRKTGDYLSIRTGTGEIGHKSLKDYMVTEKIPSKQRSQMLLLAEGAHVLWLPDYRISEYFKVSGNTNYILQVQLVRGCSQMEEKDGKTSCC